MEQKKDKSYIGVNSFNIVNYIAYLYWKQVLLFKDTIKAYF